jgi:tol-pal system protein YbgF
MKALRIALATAGLLSSATLMAAPTTAQRLDVLERRVSRVTELTLQMDELRSENRQLRGEIENLGYEIEQLKRKQRDIYLDIDQRLSGGQGAGTPPAGEPAATPEAGQTPAPVAVESRSPAPVVASGNRSKIQAEYQAAYDLLSPQQRRYDDAAKAFASFLKKYPQDPLAPNAQYWLGEANYVSQHNAEAQQAFELVVERYPDSTKAPGALFKIGRLQQAAGKNDAARASFQRVLTDYPDSPAAGLARQRLEQLGAGR